MKIKKHYFTVLILFSAFLMIFFSLNTSAVSEGKSRLIDNAKILNSSEFESISSKLDEISERQNIDVMILTEKSLGGKSMRDYSDDYFDYNGYGMGSERSGVLLLLDMGERDSYISTSGRAEKAFTLAGIDYISEQILPEMKSDNYDKAFETFANLCDEFITKANTDKPYDRGNLPKNPFNISFWIPAAILIGIAAAWLVTKYMKMQLKTVSQKSKADDYIQKNSLQIKNSRDVFLYSNIVRHARPKSRSGSGTHRSSSGRIHGGGRVGKF